MADSQPSIDQLSSTQQAALQTYTAVTDQDISSAIPLLQRSEWNVNIAIAKFFDGEVPDPVEEARASINSPPPSQHELYREALLDRSGAFVRRRRSPRKDPAPRIIPQRPEQTRWQPPLILSIIFTPINALYRLVSSSLNIFTYLFPFLTRRPPFSGRAITLIANTDHSTLEPRETALRAIANFKQNFRETPVLPFFENGYAQAYDLAKKDLKFLLVILLSYEHDDNARFVQNTILSPDVSSFLNDPANKVILWLGDVQDSEAYQVSTALDCTKLPFIALIVHTPQSSSTAMATVARVGGPVSSTDFISRLRDAIDRYSPPLERVQATRREQQASRSLREEQNSAYERSLAQDRERARQRREAETEKQQMERLAKAEAERLARAQKWAGEWKRRRASAIKPEPGPDIKECTRISIRLPSGERIVRKFSSDTQVEELYAFVECHGLPSTEENQLSAEVELPASYQHHYGFKLVSPLPRTVYEASDLGPIGSLIGRSGNLIVEPVQDDEEEDEGD